MKNFLIFVFALLTISSTFGQKPKTADVSTGFDGSKNAVFFEFLGNGILGSFNYDTRLSGKFGARVGIGFIGSKEENILTIPVVANYLLGKNGRYFEIGLGATYISGSSDFFEETDSNIWGTMSFMYRSQPVNGGFMWKIGITPIFADGFFFPYYGGVSLGYAW